MSFAKSEIKGERGKEVEAQLANIWSDILNEENGGSTSISNSDKFLDIGGDSLAAIVCISRMREAFGVEFTIEDFFFEDASVSTFAKMIIEAEANKEGEL